MGYYSEVAYAVLFKDSADRDTILAELTPEQQEIIKKESDVQEDRILFHHPSAKWYSTRLVGASGSRGFEDVDAHEDLLEKARAAYFDDRITCMGVFMRLGEDDDDSERDSWSGSEDGFPEWHDLVEYSRSLTINW